MNKLDAGYISVMKKSTRERMNFQHDGYLGEFPVGEKLILRVDLPEDVKPVDICRSTGNIRERRIKGNGRPYVEQIVAVLRSNDGEPFTSSHSNAIRLFEYGESGQVVVWSVGIFAQDGQFFVGIQKDYEMQFIQDENGLIVCPEKEETWPDFCKFVRESAELNAVPKSTVKPDREDLNLRYDQAQVKWYNPLTGVGCVRLSGIMAAKNGIKSQQAKVHFTQIASEQNKRLRKLEPGQLVVYDQLRKLNRRYGQRKSNFEAEVLGVRPIK